MKTVSDRIFELLKEKGMSQKEFAAKTGIAESTISDWKKKKTMLQNLMRHSGSQRQRQGRC